MSAVFKSENGHRLVHEAYRALLADWPAPNAQMRTPTREGETFVIACGPPTAPPVLLLHGANSTAAAWMFDAAIWSQDFRVYAVDLIGEAGFSAPSRPPLETDAHALWLDDVLDGLGVGAVSLVGISLGGWLALDYATRRPDRVASVAVLCPAGVGAQKNFLLSVFPLLFMGAWGQRKIREMVFGPPGGEPPARVRRLSTFLVLLLAHARRRNIKIPVLSDDALARLTMPLLAILGGKDVLLDSAGTRDRLARHVPHAEIIYLPDAPHALRNQTAPIHAFLQRTTPAHDRAAAQP
jgi:pimeloyl-ACP methyl ester carboxylesterase